MVTWLLEYRSLGDLIPGRKKTTVDIKYDKEERFKGFFIAFRG